MVKKGMRRKKDFFFLKYNAYLRNSIANNTAENLLRAKKQDDQYDVWLKYHVISYPNTNQTIIGSHLFTLLHQARHEREAYARYRISHLNTLRQFVEQNRAWKDLSETFLLIEKSLYESQKLPADQLRTELYDLLRMHIDYPKWIFGIDKKGYPIYQTHPFYITRPLLSFIMKEGNLGRKKVRVVEPIQYQHIEFSNYLATAYALYDEDTLDLIAANGVNYNIIPDIQFPRSLGDMDDWADLIQQNRKYTMNPYGVVIDCYNAGDIDQIVMVERNGYLIWKVHFKKPGWVINNKGELTEDPRGAEYMGYFNPDLYPHSTFTVHTDFIDFETKVYEFVLECYAEIVCGTDVVNRRFRLRDVVNKGAVQMMENAPQEEDKRMGFRFTPRRVYNSAKRKAKTRNEFEQEIRRYFVAGHIRRLPEGQQASRDAINHAREYGIEIPDGYTFVRPYEAGQEKVRTHYIKRV